MGCKLRVAIECRLTDVHQGIGTAIAALAKALSESNVATQEFTFIVHAEMKHWLEPYVHGPCKLYVLPSSPLTALKASFRRFPLLRSVRARVSRKANQVPVSDGYVESQHYDVVHFPAQGAYLTDLPTIYQPHDLQHLHFPQFFSKFEFEKREREYRAFCHQARFVCVHTEWTKQDVMTLYGMSPDKLAVIPWGSAFEAYTEPAPDEVSAAVARFNLPKTFFFYPAVTWPHKNHEAILHALCLLKNEFALTPPVYFTGSSTPHRTYLNTVARKLGVAAQLHFLGFLPPSDLRAIFKTATAMIYPSKFEGFGIPILEAFQSHLPVLASTATTLPEVAQNAALYFDPDSPAELSSQMKVILEEPELRELLITKGMQVLSRYSFAKAARSFIGLYEKAAEKPHDDV